MSHLENGLIDTTLKEVIVEDPEASFYCPANVEIVGDLKASLFYLVDDEISSFQQQTTISRD